MTALAGFDFSIEFSEALATRIVTILFKDKATPGRFWYGDKGWPGLLSTRQMAGGAFAYQNYLLEIEGGYDFVLSDPRVSFVGGNTQLVQIDFAFGVKLPRNVVGRSFDPAATDTPLAMDPKDVKLGVLYTEKYRTAPSNDPYPGAASPYTTGRLTIRFSPVQVPFGNGRRVSASTNRVSLSDVVSVKVDGPFDATLVKFLQRLAAKSYSELIRREVDDYDLTSLVGDLQAFGLQLRDPVAVRIGTSGKSHLIAFAANEYATVGDGDPKQLPFLCGNADFCVSFREAMFNELIVGLYQDDVLPNHFRLNGFPDKHGRVFLEQPRLVFQRNALNVIFRLQVLAGGGAPVAVSVSAVVVFKPGAAGQLLVQLVSSDVDVQFPGLSVAWIADTITFHLLSALVGGILTSMLQAPVKNSLDNGLQAFLDSGALAFAFRAPIRGTKRFTQIAPESFVFRPGVCTLTGHVDVL